MALFFGSVFNLLTRTWYIIDMRESADSKEALKDGVDTVPIVDSPSSDGTVASDEKLPGQQ
jgi:hypothetical protein